MSFGDRKHFCVRMCFEGKGDSNISFLFRIFIRHEGFLLRCFMFCFRLVSFVSMLIWLLLSGLVLSENIFI